MSSVAEYGTTQAEQSSKWILPRTLMGGTKAMRVAGERYLPKEAAEDETSYRSRLARSVLFNAFRKTVRDMTGKVFQKDIVIEDSVPQALREWLENCDMAGRSLNVFARDTFADCMPVGIGFLFVDMPPAVAVEGREATLADEQAAGIRPYLSYIRVEDALGWKHRIGPNGMELTQFRFVERVSVPINQWHDEVVTQIRVILPGAWEIWREADAAEPGPNGEQRREWRLFQSGTRSINEVPVVPVYLNRTGFMTADPPLEDLADLNVLHWQSSSDQRNILHVARVPILFGRGFGNEADTLAVGASAMVKAASAEADMKYVEHTGAAINAGRQDLQDVEFQMQTQGLQLLVGTPGQSATGEVADDIKENSPLAAMATGLEDALEMALIYMALYGNLGPDGGTLMVNKDYGITERDSSDLSVLLAACNAGKLSRRTFWRECVRRGVLKDDFDAETEAEEIEQDMPDLPAATTGDTAAMGQGGRV